VDKKIPTWFLQQFGDDTFITMTKMEGHKMDKHIKKLQDQTEHKEIVKYTQHVLEAIDILVDEHRRIVSLNSLAGIKPNGDKEHTFYRSMHDVKRILIVELEKTIEDFKHIGDKHYVSNYPDGVKQ
jgi:hypothetical protein